MADLVNILCLPYPPARGPHPPQPWRLGIPGYIIDFVKLHALFESWFSHLEKADDNVSCGVCGQVM